jgi:lincosamide nucleotidyltransferase A/C/D/E
MPEMTQDDVIEVLGLAERLGLSFWVDGGWAVDAVLGRQTRVHDDLDILIQRRDELVLVSAFRDAGFGPIGRDDTTTWNYILGDARGREIDFHVIEPGDSGVWHYGPAGGPPREVILEQDLTGRG